LVICSSTRVSLEDSGCRDFADSFSTTSYSLKLILTRLILFFVLVITLILQQFLHWAALWNNYPPQSVNQKLVFAFLPISNFGTKQRFFWIFHLTLELHSHKFGIDLKSYLPKVNDDLLPTNLKIPQ